MALISCPSCGKQISDKATACPHCGTAQTPVTPTTPTPEPQQQPKGNGKKIAIGAAVAAVALLVAIPVFTSVSNNEPQGHIVDDSTGLAVSGQSSYDYSDAYVSVDNFSGNSSNTVVDEPEETYYDVTLHMECRQNLSENKYDVDILVDGKIVATLGHGMTDDYDLELSKGSHNLEFRINGRDKNNYEIYDPTNSDTFVKKVISVSKNKLFSYRAKLTWGSGTPLEGVALQIEQKS